MGSDLDSDGDTTVYKMLKNMKKINIRMPKVILSFFIAILNEKDYFDSGIINQDMVSKVK